jgi:hypothetical protein
MGVREKGSPALDAEDQMGLSATAVGATGSRSATSANRLARFHNLLRDLDLAAARSRPTSEQRTGNDA